MPTPPADDVEQAPSSATAPRPAGDTHPTVDEMGEWSFPASDPPATWTWDVKRPPRETAQ